MTALLTLERSTQLDVMCSLILDSNERITLVAIIDQKGRVIENSMRDDRVIKNLTDQKKEMLFMESALQLSMIRDFDDDFGAMKYTYSTREKISFFTFSLDGYAVIVLSEPSENPLLLAAQVVEIINSPIESNNEIAN
ncbi:MAG TPA: hypothetical protein VGR54_02295 [Nitrosopumilaceae archaeon]|nr:hypothetical protein [Nitrosopumilaceae archaeon]